MFDLSDIFIFISSIAVGSVLGWSFNAWVNRDRRKVQARGWNLFETHVQAEQRIAFGLGFTRQPMPVQASPWFRAAYEAGSSVKNTHGHMSADAAFQLWEDGV